MWRERFAVALIVLVAWIAAIQTGPESEPRDTGYTGTQGKESPLSGRRDNSIHDWQEAGITDRKETGNREGHARNLQDGESGYGFLARHLWDEEVMSPGQDEPADKTSREVAKEGLFTRHPMDGFEGNGLLARHLWDEESISPVRILTSPDSAHRNWEFAPNLYEGHRGEGLLAQVPGSTTVLPTQDESAFMATDWPVRHLLDEALGGNGILAHFIWDEERGVPAAPLAPQTDFMAREDALGGQRLLAQHIWDEESRPAGNASGTGSR